MLFPGKHRDIAFINNAFIQIKKSIVRNIYFRINKTGRIRFNLRKADHIPFPVLIDIIEITATVKSIPAL